jgi:uncharacterized membrane protein YjdF
MIYIGETLIELYAKFGINPEDKKTWKREKQPTLLDLYDLWERDKKRYKNDATCYNSDQFIFFFLRHS